MQHLIGLFALILVVSSGSSFGQESATEGPKSDAVTSGRALIREHREKIIHSELHFTEKEAKEFWPVYETYRQKNNVIMDRYANLIAEYMRRYDDADLSNEYADQMIDTYFEIQNDLLQLQEKFLPEFRAILPALKVARFYQLENKINADIDAQLALIVPLVDPS